MISASRHPDAWHLFSLGPCAIRLLEISDSALDSRPFVGGILHLKKHRNTHTKKTHVKKKHPSKTVILGLHVIYTYALLCTNISSLHVLPSVQTD